MSQAWNSWYENHLEQQRLKHLTSKALRMWRNRVRVCDKVWKARVFVWVVGVCLCGRRCRCGCVSAWVSCCSECFCRLHVDTCRCIVPHDSTNVSIRQHTSRLHVDTCRCIVPHDSRKQHWHCTKLHSQNSTESVCLCVAPCVSVCLRVAPVCLCVAPSQSQTHMRRCI